MRRAIRRGENAGLTFELIGHSTEPEDLYQRILKIESHSWKGLAGEGYDSGPGADFYRDIVNRLSLRNGLRAIFAQREGQDVGFVFGGVTQGQYRGLQLSFMQGQKSGKSVISCNGK